MDHGWGFWHLFWLFLNILMWVVCLMGGWMLVREIHRQLRPPPEPRRDPQAEAPRGGS